MDPERIADRYDVVRAVGRGGMGTVWLCHDTVLGRDVAVKQIGALPGESASDTARAMREARSAAALNHPNAVAVYDVVDHDGRPWMVMEYVEGETLADVIAREGRLAPQRVADLGSHLASALHRAHERGIVHRDIKPGNVLIDRAGRPKISDFGIARGHGDDQLTQTGFVTGTPGYLSPQLARGDDPDSASDVWALGATLYAAVEGRAPFAPRSNPIALLQAIATEQPLPMEHAGPLSGAIAAMMAEPEDRWDMDTAARQLALVAGGDTTLAMPVGGAPTAVLPAPMAVERTQRLAPGAAVGSAGHGPDLGAGPDRGPGGGPGDRDEQRGGRAWLPALLALLVLAALGVAYLLSPLGDDPGGAASGQSPTTTVPTSPAQTTPAQTATQTTPAETPSSTPAETTTTTSAPTTADRQDTRRLEKFVRDYFKDVTSDRDKTWDQLTPRMQEAVGGREEYDAFWGNIDSVKVNELRGDASQGSALVSLTYQREDGADSTETHELTLVEQDGDYLIDSDRQIG